MSSPFCATLASATSAWTSTFRPPQGVTFEAMANSARAHRVLIVGLGGLGCPVAQVLSRVPELELWLCDDDVVELSNLHRQTLYGEADVGQDKLESAQKALISAGADPA